MTRLHVGLVSILNVFRSPNYEILEYLCDYLADSLSYLLANSLGLGSNKLLD